MTKVPLRDWEILMLDDVLRRTERERWDNEGMRQIRLLTEKFKAHAANTRTAKAARRRYERAVRFVYLPTAPSGEE